MNLERLALHAGLRSDFGAFCMMAFPTVDQRHSLEWNWHLDALTYHLQEAEAGRIKRLLITIPPRHLKSFCGSSAFPAWVLGRNPARRVVCASYAQDLAVALANDCRRILTSSWYRRLFPGTSLSGLKNTQDEFQTTRGGGRLATSVGGVLTGRGGDFMIIDDPMKPVDASSEVELRRVREWYRGTVYSRFDSQRDGVLILIMQRLHMDDLAGYVLDSGEWTHLDLPAWSDDAQRVLIGPGEYYERPAGSLLHPDRFPQSVLDDLKRTLGSASFSAQYLQSPVPQDGDIFKWAWFKTYDGLPPRGAYDEIIQSWDSASKGGEFNDYSVCTTWLLQEGRYYLLDVLRERLNYPSLRRKVIEMAERYRPSAVLIEDKGSGEALIPDLESDGRVFVIPVNPKGDKAMRAHATTARIEAGQVYLPSQAPWLDTFKMEVLAFPAGRHDDQVDSMTQFLRWAAEREYAEPRARWLD